MGEEFSTSLVIGQPRDAPLSLTADYVQVIYTPSWFAESILAMIEFHFDSAELSIALNANSDHVCGLSRAVIVEDDLIGWGVPQLLD